MTVNNIEVLQKNYMRRMPVEDAWLNYGLDSLIYSYMVNIASARPIKTSTGESYELYLSQKKYKRHKKNIARLCENVTTKTVDRRLEKIIKEGYIILDESAEEPVFLFPHDRSQHYFMISNETLYFFVSTSSSLMIKLYVYLGYKWNWKAYQNEHSYDFTLKELAEMMGYSKNGRNPNVETSIVMCLNVMKRNGFIDFEERYIKGASHVYKTYTLTSFDGQRKLPKALRTDILAMVSENRLITASFEEPVALPGYAEQAAVQVE